MAFQSLYRRYRSQTFDEVLGQDHVTRALKNAVREERVAQGYLFSGPRGTGKTSTARILAKVLNCEHPADGEPDTTCPNCVSVQTGRMTDWLQELDAASNNGVGDMRSLLERVSMGTSGARKVYILDEVHMLTTGASNALLKTLEEPPDHVVFVLATTEPNKVLPTIRSRTQHFEFNLLSAPVLAEHVRHVIADAGLDLGEDAVEYVVRAGGGSARDTLSALDQVAAAGGVLDDSTSADDLLDALATHDAGRALASVDAAIRAGRDPSVLGHGLIESLRHAFLAAMDAPISGLSDREVARATELASRIGRSGLTRSLEAIGAALIEMRQAADARVPLEVALVRLTRPDTSGDLDALIARVERLEAALAGGVAPATAPAAPVDASVTSLPTSAPASADAPPVAIPPRPPARGAQAARERLAARHDEPSPATEPEPAPDRSASRPALGGVRAQRAAETADPAPPSAPEPPSAPAAAAAPTVEPAPTTPPPGSEGPVSAADVERIWSEVLAAAKPRTRALFKVGDLVDADGRVHLVLPNEAHRDQCMAKHDEVLEALAGALGRRVPLELVAAAGAAPAPRPTPGVAAPTVVDAPEEIDAIDLDDLVDAPDASVGPVARLQEAFPGSELDDA